MNPRRRRRLRLARKERVVQTLPHGKVRRSLRTARREKQRYVDLALQAQAKRIAPFIIGAGALLGLFVLRQLVQVSPSEVSP